MRNNKIIESFPRFFVPVSLIILAFVFFSATAREVSASNAWPMYQQNASHTGHMPISVNPRQFSLRWERTIGTLDLNPVTAAEGMVFVSEKGYFNDPGLYALDAGTGTTLWSKNYGDVYTVNPPSYAYGNVYIQTGNHSDDTYLRAYKADTGDFVFRTAHSAQWERYYAPTIYNGSIYVNGGYYGGMYAFDAFSGEQNWFQELPHYDEWTPAVDENLAYAYVGDYFPGLYAFDRLTGSPVFMIPDTDFDWNGWSMNLAPVLGSMQDVIAIHNGRLISFDIVEENIRWQLDENFSGQPSVVDGVIYSIASGALNAREQMTGELIWGWEPPSGNLEGAIVVTDSHLFVRTSNDVYSVSLITHDHDWSYPVAGHVAITEDTLYIAGVDGLLVAINILPVADIKANGSDGPLYVSIGENVEVTVSLDPGSFRGISCDWWVGGMTAYGTYWYNSLFTWEKSDIPISVIQYPLIDLPASSILDRPLPMGFYYFFFVLDDNPNGIFDSLKWYDYVEVVVDPIPLKQRSQSLPNFQSLFLEKIKELMQN